MYAALGIVFIVAGAILTFAIDREAEGVDIDAIGWILMAGGVVALLVALFQAAAGTSWRKRHYVNIMKSLELPWYRGEREALEFFQ